MKTASPAPISSPPAGPAVSETALDEARFNSRAFRIVVAGFLALLLAFAAIVYAFALNQNSDERIIHSYEVIDEVSTLEVWVERSQTALRGYLLMPDPVRIKTYRDNRVKAAESIGLLERLVADNPAQIERLDALKAQIRGELAFDDQIMKRAVAGDLAGATDTFVRALAARRVNDIRAKAAQIRAVEFDLLAERTGNEARWRTIAEVLMGLTLLVLVAVAVATSRLVRRFIGDLTRSRAVLHRLNTDLEGAVAERTAELTRANSEIQRFAYIVSHDLRSPLVNVMGFTSELERAAAIIADRFAKIAEANPALADRDAQLAVEEDLPEAIGFVKSSTQKMDRLINAILGLSRQGRRVLSPEPVDLTAMAHDIAASVTAQAEGKGAHVSVEGALPAIVTDRLAIEQVISNLVDNAVKYLDPARPGAIVVRGRAEGARVIVEVEDNGRGVAEADHERIFELFRRSGPQDQRGEGIGLAHVRALAYRLGGTVTIRSELGSGSTFIIDLPARLAGEGEVE